MNDLVNNLVNGFLDSCDRIKEWLIECWNTNRVLFLAVTGLLVCIFSGIILLISLAGKDDTGPVSIPANVEFFLEYPGEPDFPDEYILEKKDVQLDNSFVSDWFSPVNDDLLDELGRVTHSITESILEAVP